MKKIIVILSLLFVLPITVFAAETPVVSKLELTNEKGTIKYNGEITIPENSVPAYAVMCKLYSGDDEIDLFSSEVVDNKFEGSFTIAKNGTYTVYCANYDSGAIKSETIKIEDVVNPKTGDLVEVYCIVFAFCIAALTLACAYPKYLKKSKKTTGSAVKKTTTKKTSTPKKTATKKTSKK